VIFESCYVLWGLALFEITYAVGVLVREDDGDSLVLLQHHSRVRAQVKCCIAKTSMRCIKSSPLAQGKSKVTSLLVFEF
jgi:hypothetical protein